MVKEQAGLARPQVPQTAEISTIQMGESNALHRLGLGLALGLTFAAYSGALCFQFVYDDRPQIVENPLVHSWRYVPRYFAEHVWESIKPEESGNYYRPIFLLWLRINDAVFGLEPWGWHLTTILAHLGVTLLVYFLASRIAGERLTAAVAAMIFGLHPAHIEAVAWPSGVTEPLLGALLIASFLCYLKTREPRSRAPAWQAASLLLFAVAMLAKETALVLPMLVFAYEWNFTPGTGKDNPPGPRGQRMRNAARCALPYLALIPPYLLARSLALRGFSHPPTSLPLSAVIQTWPQLLWFYMKHLLWPVGVSTFYEFPPVTHPSLTNFVLPAAAVIAAAMGLLWWSRQSRPVAFASVWSAVPLIPVLDIRVFTDGDFAHDRYLYLPSVGLSIMAAVAWRQLKIGRGTFRGQPSAQIVTVLVAAGLLGLGTACQDLYFANDMEFYRYSLKVAPSNRNVKTNLAALRGGQGSYQESIRLCQEVLDRDPDFWPANYNLGYTYYTLGNLEEADWYLSRAIEFNRYNAPGFLYLGLTRLKRGRVNEAAAALRQAVRIRPEGYGFHAALGVVLRLQGDLVGALREFNAELVNYPQEATARKQIAEVEERLHAITPGTPSSSDSPKSGPPRRQ